MEQRHIRAADVAEIVEVAKIVRRLTLRKLERLAAIIWTHLRVAISSFHHDFAFVSPRANHQMMQSEIGERQ
jgi:hypothetical protein